MLDLSKTCFLNQDNLLHETVERSLSGLIFIIMIKSFINHTCTSHNGGRPKTPLRMTTHQTLAPWQKLSTFFLKLISLMAAPTSSNVGRSAPFGQKKTLWTRLAKTLHVFLSSICYLMACFPSLSFFTGMYAFTPMSHSAMMSTKAYRSH